MSPSVTMRIWPGASCFAKASKAARSEPSPPSLPVVTKTGPSAPAALARLIAAAAAKARIDRQCSFLFTCVSPKMTSDRSQLVDGHCDGFVTMVSLGGAVRHDAGAGRLGLRILRPAP